MVGSDSDEEGGVMVVSQNIKKHSIYVVKYVKYTKFIAQDLFRFASKFWRTEFLTL